MNTFLGSLSFSGLWHRRITLAVVLLMLVGESWGQIYVNSFTGTSACPTNGNTPTMALNSIGTALTRSTVTCNATANVFNSTTLNATSSVSNTSYIEFTATAAVGFQFNITSLSFLRQGSNTAPNQIEVRYSTNGFTSSTAWGAAPTTPTASAVITWDFADFSTADGGTITFRIYPYGTTRCDLTAPAAVSTGTFRVDDVTINGTVVATTPPTVSLSSPNPAVTAGSIQQGAINNVLYQLNIGVADANANLSGLQVSTGGTYVATDIVNLKAWYSTDASFSAVSDVLLATLTNPGIAGNKTFPVFSSNPTINAGSTGYIFVTADVSCSASIANNIFFNNTTQTQTTFTVTPNYNTDATWGGGLQTIIAATPNNVTALTPTAGNAQVALAWTAPAGCYDEVIIVAHTASIGGTPTGTYVAASTSYTNGSNPAFPGGGVVVYNGTASPQTITSLTNSTPYYFKVFTRLGTLWSSGVEVSATPLAANSASDFFRSNNGNTGAGADWNTPSNWQYSPDNGATVPWQTATTLVPNLNASGIVIRSGHNIALSSGSISADQLTVDASATLTVNGGQLSINNGSGTDLIVNGTLTFSSGNTIYSAGYSVSFGAGSAYNHNANSGTIPNSTWNATSTCTIAGMIGTAPLNIPQAYGNFIWNCTGQTTFVNVNNAAFSVAGTLTVSSTGSGNFTLVGATTTSYTYTIANINVTGGTFQLNFYSTSSGGTCIVNMSGNITVANSAIAILDFIGGTGAPSVGFSYPTQVNLAGNLTVGSNGYFSVSNFNTYAFGKLSFTGTACDINDPGTSSTNRGFIDFVVNTGATARLQNSLSIFFNSRLEIYGTFDNTAEYQLLDGVGGGGAPYIQIDGRFITRDAQGFSGTNAAIPGIAPVLTTGCTIEYGRANNQAVQSRADYSNITFSNSGTKTLASGCNPAGTVYITGTAIFEQSNNSFGDNGTSLTMDGGRYRLSGINTKPDIDGTYSLTGGVIEFYNIAGTAQTIKGISTGSNPVNYLAIEVTGSNVAQGSANITLQSGGTFTIKNGGVFSANIDAIVGLPGNQTVTIENGGKFVCGDVDGFSGGTGSTATSIRSDIETINLNTGSTVEYSRATAQVFSTRTDYKNVIISGGGAKTLNGASTIAEVLTLTSGLLTTTNTNLLTMSNGSSVTGASDASFVNGPMKKVGNTAFVFPVGKPLLAGPVGGGYRFIGISAPANSLDHEFTAEFYVANASLVGPVTASGLVKVSACEYWRLDRNSGISSINVTLSWAARSKCNVGAYVTNPATIVVAHNTATGYPFGSGNWNAYGRDGGNTGNNTTGTVTWNNVSTFSPFALGSINQADNPLPFTLSTFTATPKQNKVDLYWKVANNNEQQEYMLERSSDGINFKTVTVVSAKPNITIAEYRHTDEQPFNGWNYYRLRAADHQNKTQTSYIIKVWMDKGAFIYVLPNPASEKIVINLSEPSSILQMQIVNITGQVLRQLNTIQFLNEINISNLQAGMYYIRFLGKDGVTTKSFIKH